MSRRARAVSRLLTPASKPNHRPFIVQAGQTSNVDLRLGSDVVKLAEFKVAGTKEGMAQAIALQRIAIKHQDRRGGRPIRRHRRSNAAEYLKFLPGVASTTTPTTPVRPRSAA